MYLSWSGDVGGIVVEGARKTLAIPLTLRPPHWRTVYNTKNEFFPCFKRILFLNKCFELLFHICSEICPNIGKYVIISMTIISSVFRRKHFSAGACCTDESVCDVF